MNMRRFVGVALLMVAAIPTAALARDCNEVKAEIDAQIKAKGVMNYVLQVVAKEPDDKQGQVVGNCEFGAKKIVYFRGPSAKSGALKMQPKQSKPERSSSAGTPSGTEASR